MKKISIIWFKKNLRISDNSALYKASKDQKIAAIYINDPDIINNDDFSYYHLDFIKESLLELEIIFKKNKSSFNVYYDKAINVLKKINETYSIGKIITHYETGNWVTYCRDKIITNYCKENGIELLEYQSNGIVRNLSDRDGWSHLWNKEMIKNQISTPDVSGFLDLNAQSVHESFQKIKIKKKKYNKIFFGGESHATNTLHSFLNDRGNYYSKEMSSPVTADKSCSRLSSYLAYGNISIKQVLQETKKRQAFLRENKIRTGWLKSLSSFSSRLRWHCHFIQKLEMQPNLEFTNMVRAYDGLRESYDPNAFTSWKEGSTGFPMIDACMRFLKSNGWINFRMRAMLVSFASYNLWIDWRVTSKYLSKYFIDYEPGIHYNQFQMQSGVTGMNAIRIYNPVKQQQDHDSEAKFVRKWVPELLNVPLEYIQYPHLLSEKMQKKVGCIIGKHYPSPIVDLKISTLKAKKYIYDIRATQKAKIESKKAYIKHGSRRKSRNINLFK